MASELAQRLLERNVFVNAKRDKIRVVPAVTCSRRARRRTRHLAATPARQGRRQSILQACAALQPDATQDRFLSHSPLCIFIDEVWQVDSALRIGDCQVWMPIRGVCCRSYP